MKEIRQYPDCFVCSLHCFCNKYFSAGLQYLVGTWVRHSYCTIPLYSQYFPNLKINYKKVFAFMFKFHVFALLMHFMNRFCCRLWASRLTNIFPLMKNFIIFKENIQQSDISRKIKFRKIRNL